MMVGCPAPALQGNTFGDVIEYSISLKTALSVCSARIAAIRVHEANRCPDE